MLSVLPRSSFARAIGICLSAASVLVAGCETSTTVIHKSGTFDGPDGSIEREDPGGDPSDAGATDGGKLSTGAFRLVASKAHHIEKIAGADPASGNGFLVIEQTLTNESEATPLPASASRFSVESSDALVFPSDARSQLLVPVCPSAAVAKGGSVTCKVLFELPLAIKLKALRYRDVDADPARTASAPLPTTFTPLPNPLGVRCGAIAGPCPADSDAFCYFLGKYGPAYGSSTEGYCTRPCSDNASPACHDGYVGPTSGASNRCNLGDTACVMPCTSDTECPNNMKCIGGIVTQCAVPAP